MKDETRHKELMASLQVLMKVVTSTANMSVDDNRARIRGWLTLVSTEDAYEEAKRLRHQSTCDWVFDLEAFHEWTIWEGKTSKLFWLHGPAGFGKTILCSRVIDYMENQNNSDARVLFFFCSGEDHERTHPFAILKSWIGQLLIRDDAAVEVAMKDDQLQQKISEGIPVSDADQDCLWSLFRKLINEVLHCTLVIDGYDECTEASTTTSKYHTQQSCRTQFLQDLVRVIEGTGTHVLLVSRHQQDIREVVMGRCGDEQLLRVIEHPITKADTTKDVSSFSEKLFAKKLSKIGAQKRSDIAGRAVEKSEGMFLWIALLDKRLHAGATKKQVDKLLLDTPSEIDEAYQRELERILDPRGDRDLAMRAVVILKLVLFAARPLTVREMAEALAVYFNEESAEYPHDDLPDPFTEESVDGEYVGSYILKPCGSLIELRREHANIALASQTIHFVHFSVKEFLLRKPLYMSGPDQRLCFSEESTEHDWMAGICLQYMCYDEFDDESNKPIQSAEAFICTYPFFSYTATSWPGHFRRSKSGNTRPDTPNLVWKLFNKENWKIWATLFESISQDSSRDPNALQRPAWVKSPDRADSGYGSLEADQSEESGMEEDESGQESGNESLEAPTPVAERKISPSPVYYATILGLTDIVERLIESGHDCNTIGGEFGTPLQAAVVNEQRATIEVLLKHKADPSQKGGTYGTPLIAAVILGSGDIFDGLLVNCKNLDAADESGKTALHHACGLGAIDMVIKLVHAGASLSLISKSGRTPLVRALAQGHLEVVQHLLDKGADANEKIRGRQAPLLLAIEMKNEEITKLLLNHNADPHCQTPWGMTALHAACYVGSAPLAQLLLDRGAAVDATDEDGWTPLHYAASFDSKECAKLMLDARASILAETDDGSTPFAIAVRQGATSVLEVLNSHEDMSASGGTSSWPVRVAIALKEGYVDLLSSLLKDSSWSSISAEMARDILTFLLKTEQEAIYLVLGANISGPDERGDSSSGICDCPTWSNEEEDMLRDRHWGSKIQKAMILNPDLRYITGSRTVVADAMLPVALANRSHDVVKLLLERGANAYRQLRPGSTPYSPFQLAVNQDSRELVSLVLTGSRHPAPEGVLLAAVEACAQNGMAFDDMTKLLISHGALDNSPYTANSNGIDDDQDFDWWTHTLVGEWIGSYDYGSDANKETTAFQIETVHMESPSASKNVVILFSGSGEDTVAKFIIRGQVTSGTTLRFVKLYPEFGWAYEGSIEVAEEGCRMNGQWDKKFRKGHGGNFVLEKKRLH
ncbi:hypothetical protein A9Z42_0041760 [Trichoderma parareesei]|uniref:NACHT domain-containing protein n=1 Tax=Trichoderma parareesei TaxID=858221 RepID=A0A2H2ZSM3_TRIPA|nr:hypothetical protein A9Z42_0041760 [Trichoderma parareesei]